MRRTISKKPSKQRKFQRNAPLHIKRKFLSAKLDKELREKYKITRIPIVKGDHVEIKRGEFKGIKGEVVDVNYKKSFIYINTVKKHNTQNKEYLFPINPSNVIIYKLNLKDEKRKEIIKRKGGEIND